MNVIGLSQAEQSDIFSIVAGILHLGNVQFVESGNYAQIADNQGWWLTVWQNIPKHFCDIFDWANWLYF